MERKGKKAVCDFINEMCDVKVGGVSVADAQCECLLGAITVCMLCLLIIFICSLISFPFLICLEWR